MKNFELLPILEASLKALKDIAREPCQGELPREVHDMTLNHFKIVVAIAMEVWPCVDMGFKTFVLGDDVPKEMQNMARVFCDSFISTNVHPDLVELLVSMGAISTITEAQLLEPTAGIEVPTTTH